MRITWNFRHTSVFRANLKVLFTLPGDHYCSPLAHKTQSFCHAFGEHRAVNLCAHTFCKRLHTEPPGRISVYAYCKTLQQNACNFKAKISGPSVLSGAAVGRVCASFISTPQKSTLRCGFVYNLF
jgi:hypothetical protein